MAALDDLLARIQDPALRADLEREIAPLRGDRELGLVFERHLPEKVRLPELDVRRGATVEVRDDIDSPTWQVRKVVKGVAHLARNDGAGQVLTEEHPVDELVVVREFGQPIYPGLRSVGRVERGGDKPFHSVINAENYHALETLLYTCEGKVDCIYIDPPYNNGARSWKYNNDYVDSGDLYRHSKWLSMMEKRLRLAKRLLNPADSILMVTIDENEVHRLALLLGQVFPSSRVQMVTTVINPKGASLGGDFARVEEHIFYVYLGEAAIVPTESDMLNQDSKPSEQRAVKWSSLIRGGAQGIRTDSPGAYYPVFIDVAANRIHSFGEALPWGTERDAVPVPEGTVAVWPPTHTSGVEGRWGIGPEKARELYAMGALRLGRLDEAKGKFPLSYLSSGIVEKIASGEILVRGRRDDGTLLVRNTEGLALTLPRTVWRAPSHNAGEYGSKIISQLLPGRRFPFPKALYAVEDTLRFLVAHKPEALVLDFFAGSGTTTHAVMRLNHEDGGRRRSIMVTNNDVSASEADDLTAAGHRPGDTAWEGRGVFEYIAKPRIEAATTGFAPNGEPIEGEYKFTDEFPMSEGFEENVEFFKLTYEDPDRVQLGHAFEAVAPLLWLMAGAEGPRIDKIASGWALPEGGRYGVLFDADAWPGFCAAVKVAEQATHAFVVTDSDAVFQQVVTELPDTVTPVRLYESYLTSFAINTGVRS